MKINVDTRSFHEAADRPWLDLMSTRVTRTQYVARLIKVYGFEAPIAAAFAYTPRLSLAINLRERARSGLLAQDLLAAGLSPAQVAQLPQCPEVVPFHSIPEAIGWMYVVERSTLLHGQILRHLQSRLPELADACSYLAAYDGIAGSRWSTLGRAMETIARTPELKDQVHAAAVAAFQCQQRWIRNEVRAPALRWSVG